MRHIIAVVLIAKCLFACTAQSAEIWAKDGFTLATAGWMDEDMFPDWTGLKVGLEVPNGGYIWLAEKASLEFYVPCKGWVRDKGIMVMQGCPGDVADLLDSRRYKLLNVNASMACKEQGRVLMVVRLPKLSTIKSCRPTKARWVRGGYNVEK